MRGIRVVTSAFLMVAAATSMSGCLQSQQGSCTTSQGKTLNTYTFGGSWKKTQGYAEGERTADELKKNYDVLIIEPGGVNGNKARMCLVRVLDGVATGTLYQGTYTRDDKAKTLSLEYSATADGVTAPGSTASFAFQGTCNTTQMSLSYTDTQAFERYDFRSSTTAVGACLPAEQ